MIEHDECVVEPECDLGESAVIARRVLRIEFDGFGVANRVVPCVPEPSTKHAVWDQTLTGCVGRDPQVPGAGEFADLRERVFAGFGGCFATALIFDGDLSIAGADLDDGARAEDGMASLVRAPFDGFEQEGRRGPVVGAHQSTVREHRRELVGKHADPDGDNDDIVTLIAGAGDRTDKLVRGGRGHDFESMRLDPHC